MKSYKYKKIDAFTSENSMGNPAACIYLDENQALTDDETLEIAKQHKGFVMEVVYCGKRTDCSFDLIYYSSECEVNFCGHGTIACMYGLIKDTPDLLARREIEIHTRRKGKLCIYNNIAEQDAVFIAAPNPLHLDVPLSANDIARNLEIGADKLSFAYPIDFIDAGNRTLIVPINSFDDEITLFPNEQKLKDFSLANGIDVILIFCMDTSDKRHFAHTRVFAPKYGYLEDPATGSGNAAFGSYMLKNGIWNGEDITIEQGGEDRAFNTVMLSFKNSEILVGGRATTRIQGLYHL